MMVTIKTLGFSSNGQNSSYKEGTFTSLPNTQTEILRWESSLSFISISFDLNSPFSCGSGKMPGGMGLVLLGNFATKTCPLFQSLPLMKNQSQMLQ